MKKLSAVAIALLLCVNVSFAARGGSGSSSSGSSYKSTSSSSSSSGKFAIGYSKASFNTRTAGIGNVDVDEVAARFWFTDSIGIDVKLGFGTGDADTRVLVGGNVIGTIKQFNSLKIYWLAGVSFGTYKAKEFFNNGDDLDVTLIAVQGGVGAEYFILPNLSVLTEMGLRYVSANPDADGMDTVSDFGIFADWLPQAGVRFYF